MIKEKVLYDFPVDARVNLCDLASPDADLIREQARGVACLVHKSALIFDPNRDGYCLAANTRTLNERVKEIYNHELELDVPFREEPSIGNGSGFLATRSTLLTAAHCVINKDQITKDLKNMYAVFGYEKTADGTPTFFPSKDVRALDSVIQYKYTPNSPNWTDWAHVRMCEGVERAPLKLSQTEIKNPELYVVGCPEGTMLKYTGGGVVTENVRKQSFQCRINTFAGNSGSPVFDAKTHEVVGILCGGNDDYKIATDIASDALIRPQVILTPEEDESGGEGCQRINTLTQIYEYVSFSFTTFQAELMIQTPGLVLHGKCQNEGCTHFNQEKWMLRGMGQGERIFPKEEAELRCAKCHDKRIRLDKIGFYECQYRIKGLIGGRMLERDFEATCKGCVTALNLDESFVWSYIKVECKNR